jgi:hypothetical protein
MNQGEAQKILRILESFGRCYVRDNPQNTLNLVDASSAGIFAYSIIMLNTDLHNPKVRAKEKMTKEGFRRNNEKGNNGANFPDEVLNTIFDSIESNQIQLPIQDFGNKEEVVTDKATLWSDEMELYLSRAAILITMNNSSQFSKTNNVEESSVLLYKILMTGLADNPVLLPRSLFHELLGNIVSKSCESKIILPSAHLLISRVINSYFNYFSNIKDSANSFIEVKSDVGSPKSGIFNPEEISVCLESITRSRVDIVLDSSIYYNTDKRRILQLKNGLTLQVTLMVNY